jgi:hypothetical protein
MAVCRRHPPLQPAQLHRREAHYATSGVNKYSTTCKVGITPYKGTCDKTPCKDKKYCPKGKYCDRINPQVCMKQMVVHVNHMSLSAGVLVVKRSLCFKGKCSVFKVPASLSRRRITPFFDSFYVLVAP